MKHYPLPEPGRYAARIAHIPMPPEIAALPIHPEFRMPLPWFCVQDPADFRLIRPGAFGAAHRRGLCWITGKPRYPRRLAFVTGPMCVITGTSAEPPARIGPARYAAQACPFLANPRMRRNESNLPSDTTAPAGHMIARNPGVAAVLITDSYRVIQDGAGGLLVRMGPPLAVEWWAEGRAATRAEVEHSISTGLSALEEMAAQDGPEGQAELARCVEAARRWLPPAPINEEAA